ncbi:hypothetical protein LTR02_000776 [Friedmanniomyces endolithicus]|nr:hypothetical protein LTR02_000776 [Friedmanniomyces endolithicus]
MGSIASPPCPMSPSSYPSLTREQAGHLRHFHNLAAQLDGSWHHMGSQEPLQEFLDAYRYQLATMAYAVGVSHYHRQPLLRSVYKPLMRRLIHKMLCRDVWAYWFNTSLGGVRTDPSRTSLRTPWANPIARENIMYSGHLLLMVSLYAMLFDDNEFEKEGSIVFNWDPLFFGLGPEKFTYDTASLEKAILKEMERNGYVGVCCEPNMVFVVCNQFPMIAMRYNDARHSTNTIPTLLPKYQDAWKAKGGMVRSNGLFPDAWLEVQDHVLSASDPGWTAWAAAFMNTWNSSLIRELYPKQSEGYLTTIDGETRLHPTAVGNAIRALVADESLPANSEATLAKARDIVRKANAPPGFPYSKPLLAYIVMWLSELGRTAELTSLLAYTDAHLNPTWEKGGLYYPRHDIITSDFKSGADMEMEWTHMDPFAGNAAIAYSRLNVEDGQKKMWEHPWTSKEVKERVWVDGVSLADGVDFLRGVYDPDVGEGAVVMSMKCWNESVRSVRVKPVVKGLGAGKWSVWVGGEFVRTDEMGKGGKDAVELDVEVSQEMVDVVVVREA